MPGIIGGTPCMTGAGGPAAEPPAGGGGPGAGRWTMCTWAQGAEHQSQPKHAVDPHAA